MPLHTEIRLGPGHAVLDGNALLPEKRYTTPQFTAHVYCGQTAGRIKVPLGTEVGLCPSHIVLDGDPTPQKEAQPPICSPYLLWPNGWMDHYATL